ncbi:BRCT domain-containing protein [Pseudomonas sp. AN-1]|uniref:BRCT domain-containing protein n=1 Tax=Pseudomonas sp. AN-1 TaxID=3096605 RepID=UPI002A6AF344|nr:BRCT domain-containing protein [Pseudomonas sp. AN-1]WPP47727.1 BRCT domain-containing protein [Pseudomonas sp. AN-1]
MQPLRFVYRDAQGNVREWTLTRWHEHATHIQGRSEHDTTPRTFRKDRVQEYLAGAEQLQGELAPPAPLPSPRAATDDRPQILFTGFKQADRSRLEQLAAEQGLRVVKTATAQLAYLCGGYNAGPTKVLAAREKGAFILSEEQLLHLFETGEIPELTAEEEQIA